MFAAPLLFALALPAAAPDGKADRAAEIDAFWAEASRTVRDGDFAGYAALYHPDAAFVSDEKGVAVPIATQLERWRPGFEATAAGDAVAGVEFRFTTRLRGPAGDPATEFAAGLFRYVSHAPGEAGEPAVVRFESLLVRTSAGWRWVLERQLGTAAEADWDAAAPKPTW